MPVPLLLTAEELRAQTRVEDPAEDSLLLAMAEAAQEHIEALTGQALTRRAEYLRDMEWPSEGWELVRYPVHAVTSITYTDRAGATRTVDPSIYVLTPGRIARLRRRLGQSWPDIADDSEIQIQLDVGYPAGQCPAALHRACLMLVTHYYDNRGVVTFGPAVAEVPETVGALIAHHRLLSIV